MSDVCVRLSRYDISRMLAHKGVQIFPHPELSNADKVGEEVRLFFKIPEKKESE